MKVIIALFFIFAIAAAEFVVQTGEDLGKYREECVAELDIPAESVVEYKKWQFTPEGKTPCYIRCIFTKMMIFDDEHGPLIDNLVKQLGQADSTEIVKCVDNSGDDKCMWAYRGFDCFKKNNLQLIQSSVKKE